jgi:hypothetical protein
MIPAILATVLVLIPQCADMPTRAGTTWTYQARVSWAVAGSAKTRDTTLTWTTKILTTIQRDSSIVAVVENWPTSLAWWDPSHAPDTTLLVCRNDRVYHLRDGRGEGGSAVAEATSGALSLTSDNLILVLPLHERMLYGQGPSDRADTFYGWFVEAATPMPLALVRLGASPRDSLYTIAYRTVPDHQIVQFAPRLGITRYSYAHHGTVATASATLVSARVSP